jgi:hypothetical protein
MGSLRYKPGTRSAQGNGAASRALVVEAEHAWEANALINVNFTRGGRSRFGHD